MRLKQLSKLPAMNTSPMLPGKRRNTWKDKLPSGEPSPGGGGGFALIIFVILITIVIIIITQYGHLIKRLLD